MTHCWRTSEALAWVGLPPTTHRRHYSSHEQSSSAYKLTSRWLSMLWCTNNSTEESSSGSCLSSARAIVRGSSSVTLLTHQSHCSHITCHTDIRGHWLDLNSANTEWVHRHRNFHWNSTDIIDKITLNSRHTALNTTRQPRNAPQPHSNPHCLRK